MKAKQWMLRRDGTEIPCHEPVYGSGEARGTLMAAEWLYKNTVDQSTRKLIIRFISAFGRDLNIHRNAFRNLKIDMKENETHISQEFFELLIPMMRFEDHGTADELAQKVTAALNDEFIRISYSGTGSREMKFLISSSDGFNWSDTIMTFAKKHIASIAAVTIARDETATGERYFYMDESGVPYDRYPVR